MQMTTLLADTLMLYVSRKVQDIGIFKQDVTGGELCLVYKNKTKFNIRGKMLLMSVDYSKTKVILS